MKKTFTLSLAIACSVSMAFAQAVLVPNSPLKVTQAATNGATVLGAKSVSTVNTQAAGNSQNYVMGPCDTVNWTYTKGSNPWTPYNWYIGGGTVGQYGWINGVNNTNNREKAQYYDIISNPINYMTGCFIQFGLAYSTNTAKIVPIKVYDATGSGGSPGALLHTENVTIGSIMNDVNGNFYTRVMFSSPVQLPVNKRFFVSVDLSNLDWNTAKDTLSIVSNNDLETIPSAVWEKTSTNVWRRYTTTGAWNLSISLYIFPFATSYITGTYNPNDTVCAGSPTTITLAGGYNNNYTWAPATGLNTTTGGVVTATVSATTTYTITGTNINGCPYTAYAPVLVAAVNANAGANKNVCVGNTSTSITATGGSTYSWNTGATTATINVTPTATTTYTVTVGNTFGCTKTTSVSVIVNQLPAISAGTDKTICINASTVLVATNGTSYTWTPSTALSCTNCPNPTANPTVTTTYTVTGTDANGCSNVDTITVNVISCASIQEFEGLTSFDVYPNPNNGHFMVSFDVNVRDNYAIEVKNTLGQVVYSYKLGEFNGKFSKDMDLSHLGKGVYMISITNSRNESMKKVTVF